MEPVADLFTSGQVSRLTGVSLRQLDHWAWTGFLPPSYGSGADGERGEWRRYTFADLVRVRTVGELRRQGVPLGVIRTALDRLQQISTDPLCALKLVAVTGDVYVCRSQEELERATDGQLAFTVLDIGAMLRQLEGRLTALRPQSPQALASANPAQVAVAV